MTMAQPTVYIDIADWRVARDERGKEFIVRSDERAYFTGQRDNARVELFT